MVRCGIKIRVYANGWSYKVQQPDEYAAKAEAVVKRGFTALKFDPVPGIWRTYIPKEHVRHAVKVVRAVRKAVGPDVDILLELHRRLAPMHAIDVANALAEFEPYWLEEPCQCDNIEALAEVRRNSKIPVVTGEAIYTRAEFRRIFRARAVDIINPDVSNCGGILELMYIAAAAESEQIAVSPHNYNSTTVSLSSTVHAAACMPNFIITEYFLPFEELGARIAPNLAEAGQWLPPAAARSGPRSRHRRERDPRHEGTAVPAPHLPPAQGRGPLIGRRSRHVRLRKQ